MIPIYKPYIPDSSVYYATDAIKSSWISSIGEYIDRASEKLAELSSCKYVVLTNSGTAATHLVTRCLKRFHPEVKRILVPSACYVAPYNAILYDQNGWEVSCVDLRIDTWNMRIDSIREGDAVFAVHNLGNIINVPSIKKRFGCPVIEDNCEGFFGVYSGKPSGSEALCSSLSFFGNKNITCGEGGAFLTNNKDVYEFAMKLRGQGQGDVRYVHDELGYNYRMTNIQAAILLGQLQESENILKEKQRVFSRYRKNLRDVPGLLLQKTEQGTSSSLWMFGVRFDGFNGAYTLGSSFFKNRGIDTRPMFYSYKRHKHINFEGNDRVASIINSQVVVFPSFPELQNEEIDYICKKIISFRKGF